jgi:hypothetical protein
MNYAFITPSLQVNSSQVPNTKTKFITRDDPTLNVPGYYKLSSTKAQLIDSESNLITKPTNSKNKTQMGLKDHLDPFDYSLNVSNSNELSSDFETKFYYTGRDIGPGRGFGNLNISTDIRNGNPSRSLTKSYREQQEATQMFEFQYQYLTKDFQNPDHIIMPIPRGGVQTRKQPKPSKSTEPNPSLKFTY